MLVPATVLEKVACKLKERLFPKQLHHITCPERCSKKSRRDESIEVANLCGDHYIYILACEPIDFHIYLSPYGHQLYSAVRYGKLEIFQKIGSCNIGVDPHKDTLQALVQSSVGGGCR